MTALVFLPHAAFAQGQTPVLDLGALLPEGSGSASARIVQFVALITILSLAPGLLIMVTSFTRMIVALSFLRAGMGLQTTPANIVMISLALFMTFYVMGPTFDAAWKDGILPLTRNEITEEEAYTRVTTPFREFMLREVRPRDLALFADLAGTAPAEPEAVELRTLIPAFMISELRRGFEIGFLILLPFLVIDLIVATLIMSMGMMMMPPTVIALPFKILFFVLIDGWNLLIGSLVRSFT
ncbi:flagellar type III secretion system pore protein FliP [Acuticoccus sp. M5D2P5]|nr:flagellar type III secretion system pore protein FliP [Acuticoccus kalidii]MCF3932465.1 flagellar type III secretion system pore protein FliP [Acuticoccus kalidii]